MTFRFLPQPTWPTLAWLASGQFGGQDIEVRHGSGVETSDRWFGEIAWAGDYATADFDHSDLVFGSGARARGDVVDFVSASHTMDRLVWCVDGGRFLISNSLPALLLASRATIDPLYLRYPADLQSIIGGLDSYRKSLAETSPEIRLLYHDNLRLTASGLEVIAKPVIDRDLSGFEGYEHFLRESIASVLGNASDPMRQRRVSPLGTLSTGFDSPTVAALSRESGLTEAVTMTTARGGDEDSGASIGKQLGLAVHEIDRDAWRGEPLSEVPFLASDAKGEDVYFRGAETLLRDRILLTGYAAGAWAVRTAPLTSLKRADQSGLSLTEYRLDAGFLHLPVPTMGLRSGGGIEKVNRTEEMQRWARGTAYDKPFARRVLTSAGVSDDAFGIEKKAASVLLFDRRSFLTAGSLESFEAYLQHVSSLSRGAAMTHRVRNDVTSGMARLARGLAHAMPGKTAKRARRSVRLNECAEYDFRYNYLFGWAMEHAQSRYEEGIA